MAERSKTTRARARDLMPGAPERARGRAAVLASALAKGGGGCGQGRPRAAAAMVLLRVRPGSALAGVAAVVLALVGAASYGAVQRARQATTALAAGQPAALLPQGGGSGSAEERSLATRIIRADGALSAEERARDWLLGADTAESQPRIAEQLNNASYSSTDDIDTRGQDRDTNRSNDKAVGKTAAPTLEALSAYPGASSQPYLRHCIDTNSPDKSRVELFSRVAARAVATREARGAALAAQGKGASSAHSQCRKIIFFHAPKAGGTSVAGLIGRAANRGAIVSYSPWESETLRSVLPLDALHRSGQSGGYALQNAMPAAELRRMSEATALAPGERTETRVLRFHVGAAPLQAMAVTVERVRAKYERWGCSFEVVANVRESISHYVSQVEHAVCCGGQSSLMSGQGPHSAAELAVAGLVRANASLAPMIARVPSGAAGDAVAVVADVSSPNLSQRAPSSGRLPSTSGRRRLSDANSSATTDDDQPGPLPMNSTHMRTASLGLLRAFLEHEPHFGDELALRYFGSASFPQSVLNTCVDSEFVLHGGKQLHEEDWNSDSREGHGWAPPLQCASDLSTSAPGYPDGEFWRWGHVSTKLAATPVTRADAMATLWSLLETVDTFLVLLSGASDEDADALGASSHGGWDERSAAYLSALAREWGVSSGLRGGAHNVARGTASAQQELENFLRHGDGAAHAAPPQADTNHTANEGAGTMDRICERTRMHQLVFHALATVSARVG